MKILHLDSNHQLLINQLNDLGYTNHENYTASKEDILKIIHEYDGFIIRSRFSIDKQFIDAAKNLKFIGRVGAGLENIDCDYAQTKGISLIAAPEGNRNAVGEHSLAMLLSLFNKLNKADSEVRDGKWLREDNRGLELDGKTVGLIGYGNMGKAFAKKLRGFDVEVLCYDLKQGLEDENAKQVQEQQLKQQILSRQKQQQEQQQKLLLGHPEKLSEIYAENPTESKATENQTTKNNQHRSGQNNGYHFQGSSAKNNSNYGYKVTSPVRVCSPVTSIDPGRVCASGNRSVDSIKSDCIKSYNHTGQRKRWRAKGKKQR